MMAKKIIYGQSEEDANWIRRVWQWQKKKAKKAVKVLHTTKITKGYYDLIL